MYTKHASQDGMTLVELLVSIAILSLVLGGIYGLLNSAYLSYNHTRAKLESQQTARIVLDYLVFRLREIDGGNSTSRPERCIDCHSGNMDQQLANNVFMPCTTDVTIPQKAPAINAFKKITFAALPGIPPEFQTMTGNYIKFQADLLPLHGFNESFTDADGDGVWDWTANNVSYDINNNGKYDRGEPELLEDLNNNSRYDYFGEIWTLQLRKSSSGPYYELIESVNFSSLQPDLTKYNKSVYPNGGYTSIPVAYGITGLKITQVPRVSTPYPTGRDVSRKCSNPADAKGCHGSSGVINIYNNATSMDFAQFIATHKFWNIGGLSVEVTATDTKGKSQQFTKLRQFVNFRNLEINK